MCSFTVWTCSTSRRSLPDVLDDGKPRMSDIDEVKRLLARLNEDQLRRVQSHVRGMLPKHPLEERLMISADGMLDALDRAGDFTIRMIRGIFAEAAFATEVLPEISDEWRQLPLPFVGSLNNVAVSL